MTIRYVFSADQPLIIKGAKSADAQVIGEALAGITTASGGRLTPTDVVEAARNARHVLHHHFEWSDKVAAENYRLDQARCLIRIVRVEDSDATEGTRRAFVSVADNPTAYRPISEVANSQHLQEIVLRQAERDLEAFERRYRSFVEVCALVRQAREALSKRRVRKTEARPAV